MMGSVDRAMAGRSLPAVWSIPAGRVTECRDAKDDKYLEVDLAADAATIVSGDREPRHTAYDIQTARRVEDLWSR